MIILFNKNKYTLGCYLEIKSGSGGLDAEFWCKMLLRMYIKWANNNYFKNKILNQYTGIKLGIKSVTLQIYGNQVYNILLKETGIHRLVRKNPFKKSQKRQTSFSSVYVYPILNETINKISTINLDIKNLKIDTFRSSGAGGQHVNTTDSAIRITHIPTGITTKCQSQRSQHQNKKIALNQLKSKLYCLDLEKTEKQKSIINKYKPSINRGNQIRSYLLDDNIIKDLRTGKVKKNVKQFLNGKINIFKLI